MCGIVGAAARRDISEILLEGLKTLEYRGYDSAGVAILRTADGKLERQRTVGRVAELESTLTSEPIPGHTGIAHTRWATHGEPAIKNAHPHASSSRVCLVHNGIIENFETLRDELIAGGFQFESETDTEVIAHLIASQWGEGVDFLEAVRSAVARLEGAYALGIVSPDEPGRVIAARAGSPLVVGIGDGENFVASDVLALRTVTDRFIFLEEGDLVDLDNDTVRVLNLEGETMHREIATVELEDDAADMGDYAHFMKKEIHEQGRVVRDTLEERLGRTQVLEPAFGVKATPILDSTDAVTIVACGTSFYAASIARYWMEEIAGIPCQVEIASEFRYRKLVVAKNSLFVTISQSGETADTLAALRIAKAEGFSHTLTICNVPTSSLVRESDLALMIRAGVEIGVASTKAFTAQLVDLMLLTILLARRRGLDDAREAELVGHLHALAGHVESALEMDKLTLELAHEFVEKDHALFLGRGSNYPVAYEGALKLKEISYIHAEAYPAGELKHGPIALIDSEMPIVAVAPNDGLGDKLYSNLLEVRARGGQIYVFADPEVEIREDEGIRVIPMPSVDRIIAPIVYTIPLQLLAYHVAVLRDADVDKPRNLAKSVTVE